MQDQLRKTVKKLMIDLGYDRKFGVSDLARAIGIGRTSLSMALNGYRGTNAEHNHLVMALDYLVKKQSG